MNDEALSILNKDISSQIRVMNLLVKKLEGRQVEITSHYIGRFYIESLKGTVQTISSAFVDVDGIHIYLKGYEYECPALHRDEFVLLDLGESK